MTTIRLKRAYDDASAEDGTRILVERLWPRGVTKERAAIDAWIKEVAPSPELRRWFAHDRAKWDEFRNRYRDELERNGDGVAELRTHLTGTVTFVFAARDETHNSAVVLREWLEEG